MPPVVQAKNVSFAYTRMPVLENVSFAVEAGDYGKHLP